MCVSVGVDDVGGCVVDVILCEGCVMWEIVFWNYVLRDGVFVVVKFFVMMVLVFDVVVVRDGDEGVVMLGFELNVGDVDLGMVVLRWVNWDFK